MESLDKSVLPQSLSHLILLKYLLVLTFIIFYTYIGILFGSLSFSLFFRRRAAKTGNPEGAKAFLASLGIKDLPFHDLSGAWRKIPLSDLLKYKQGREGLKYFSDQPGG